MKSPANEAEFSFYILTLGVSLRERASRQDVQRAASKKEYDVNRNFLEHVPHDDPIVEYLLDEKKAPREQRFAQLAAPALCAPV